jgi:hypothetical protein
MKWQILILMALLIACAPAVDKTTEIASEKNTEVSEPAVKSEVTDMAALIATGKPVKCVYEQADQTITTYMKGSQMRMDSVPSDSHSINTADRIYTWSGKEGTVMKMEDIARLPENAGQPSSQEKTTTTAEKPSPKCEATSIDESMFTPPADVTFQDMSEMLKQAESAMKGLK